MKINVTQRDIDTGIPSSPDFCAAVKAIRRRVKADVEVRTHTISFWISGQFFAIRTPNDLYHFINCFDAGEKVEPFKFDLDF